MPTFNDPAYQSSPFVSPTQIIQASHHNSLLNEVRSQFQATENQLNMNFGGIGLQKNYIGNGQVTSSKISIQAGLVLPNNGQVVSPNPIPANGSYISGNFGNFTIVWDADNRFGTVFFDITAVLSAMISNPQNLSGGFFGLGGQVEMYARVNNTNQFIGGASFDGFDGNYHNRFNFNSNLVNSNGQFFLVNYQPSMSVSDSLLFRNSNGQANTEFFFRAYVYNSSQFATANTNRGRVKVVRVKYMIFNNTNA